MCGIIGLILGHWESQSDQNVAAIDLHEALYYLQHRGQDAAGIATCSTGGRMYAKPPNIVLLQKRKLLTGLAADRYQCKGNGMAGAVFKNGERISHLPGFMGIGKRRAMSGT